MSLKPPVNSNDHIQGKENAPIEIVEYGDYECSYCRKAYPIVKELQYRLKDKMKFVFRNFPLTDIHPHALNAATTAEVAADFGVFWQMHDLLYENQAYLNNEDLLSYAEQLGIDADAFRQKLSERTKYTDKIETDLESGLRSGVNGTPSFYINGDKYRGNPYSVEEFMEYIGME